MCLNPQSGGDFEGFVAFNRQPEHLVFAQRESFGEFFNGFTQVVFIVADKEVVAERYKDLLDALVAPTTMGEDPAAAFRIQRRCCCGL